MDSLYLFPQDDNAPQKTCTGPCGRTLDATPEYFHANKKGKYGFAERCKQCRLAEAKDYHGTHREERKAYNANWYQENKDRQKLYNAKTYQEHAEERAISSAKYHNEHREEILSRKAKYREENPDKIKQYFQTERGIIAKRTGAHNRRALKRNAEGKHTTEELYQQLKRQKNKCYYCKEKLGEGRNNWNADHVVPLSKGGSNSIDNIVIACPKCNRDKYNRMLHEWENGGRLL